MRMYMIFYRIEDLWWPFGAHLLHIKWSIIRAMYNNAKFIYEKNSNAMFPGGDVSHYFEKWSDVPSPDDEIVQIQPINPCYHEPHMFTQYVAPGYVTIEEMHSAILRRVYRPSEMVQRHLAGHKFLTSLNERYIGMHVRWSDKIQGSAKETEFIPISVYLDACNEVRDSTGVSTVVLCSDTYDAISEVEKHNSEPQYRFNIVYNADEIRSKNTAVDSVVHRAHTGQLSQSELEAEYLTCFVNMKILIDAVSIVGNYDSCFCLVAVQIRNTPERDKNVKTGKAVYGLHNKF